MNKATALPTIKGVTLHPADTLGVCDYCNLEVLPAIGEQLFYAGASVICTSCVVIERVREV